MQVLAEHQWDGTVVDEDHVHCGALPVVNEGGCGRPQGLVHIARIGFADAGVSRARCARAGVRFRDVDVEKYSSFSTQVFRPDADTVPTKSSLKIIPK
jgi:hypothetical protein